MDYAKLLITKKDEIEKEIKELHEVLKSHGNVGTKEPLVDSDGYPRNDIDVYQVRITRNKLACLQNDHKKIMKEIEDEIHSIHAKNRPSTSNDIRIVDVKIEPLRQPFATINIVSKNSPAETAGLRVQDMIVQFGSVNKSNFKNLHSIASVVQHSEGKNIEISVLREENLLRIMLTPQKWSGQGLLGCNIVPLVT